MKDYLNGKIKQAASSLAQTSLLYMKNSSLRGYGMKNKVAELIGHLQCALFPIIYESEDIDEKYIEALVQNRLNTASVLLPKLLSQALSDLCTEDKGNDCDLCAENADDITQAFIESLPGVSAMLYSDIQAAFDGDPAAKSKEEIMLSYPCFEAITVYRLAHELWVSGVPIIPRMMSEWAHSLTGIDIHPGAKIGKSFFIDHGTGVVIGETTVIGSNVKLYQGVTLGAKSFLTDEKGTILAIKRHPNIEDNVIIYAHATILGGDTTVGHDSIIGGNVWLTESVPAYSYVYNTTPQPMVIGNNKA
ncbi:MAG: serine acetyltransferase [Eubacteriaceae bacterium]|nr:serine acetyltransferase [Eubacteriaceae bacterium]